MLSAPFQKNSARCQCSMPQCWVSDAMRDVDRRDGQHLTENDIGFNASFILGGQIKGEPPRLFAARRI